MAAKTDRLDSTNSWCLLSKELEFVACYTNSVDAAKGLLLRWLSKRKIDWICEELSYDPRWTAKARHLFFWYFDPDLGITGPEVDWGQSNAVRRGPLFVLNERAAVEGGLKQPGSSSVSVPPLMLVADGWEMAIIMRGQQTIIEALLI
jgi:hypothetical protein